MKILFLFLSSLAVAQVPQMPNPVSICAESQACVVTTVSDPNARFQLGAGSAWCPTFNTPTLPFTVTSSNPVCASNSVQKMDTTLSGQQRNTTYFVTYTLGGVVQPVKTVVGLLVTPTVIASYNCTINVYSDGTFQSSNCSAVK